MKDIEDFRFQIGLECPTNFSLSFVEFEFVVFTRYLHRLHDKLKFVGHSSQSKI